MRRVSYDWIVSQQEYWKETNLSKDLKASMIALTNKLMHRLIDNGHDLDSVSLFYPEDCDNERAFLKVADSLNAFATLDRNGGMTMSRFGCNHDVEIE